LFRGLGAVVNVFALECFLDELAALSGHDPVASRRDMRDDPRARWLVAGCAGDVPLRLQPQLHQRSGGSSPNPRK
jgi:hypothetical protein